VEPYKELDLSVGFDGFFKKDMQTRRYRDWAVVSYHDHSRRVGLALMGEVLYPNLKLSSEKVDFGSLMSDTKKAITVSGLKFSYVFVSTFYVIFASQ
jgi:hypothetical protein